MEWGKGGSRGKKYVYINYDWYTLMYSRDHHNIVKQLSVNKKVKWIINKDLVYGTGNSAQCFVAAWMGGSLRENGHMYMYG